MTHSALDMGTRDGCMHGVGAVPTEGRQDALNAYFHRQSRYWAEIYQRAGLKEAIHQDRLRAALAMVDALRLPAHARVLDVGCGAGFASVEIARRELKVDALDAVGTMAQATRARALRAGLEANMTTHVGDIHALPFEDHSFVLVVALGVLPWLPQMERPLSEMTRVLRPGGHLIVSVDTQWQLRHMLDPLRNPLLSRPKRWAVDVWRAWHGLAPKLRPNVISINGIRRLLSTRGCETLHGIALGFGPFTFFDRQIVPHSWGLQLNRRLQSLASRGAPILRSSGAQYLILAKKRAECRN